jgi:hypothetical protein
MGTYKDQCLPRNVSAYPLPARLYILMFGVYYPVVLHAENQVGKTEQTRDYWRLTPGSWKIVSYRRS